MLRVTEYFAKSLTVTGQKLSNGNSSVILSDMAKNKVLNDTTHRATSLQPLS